MRRAVAAADAHSVKVQAKGASVIRKGRKKEGKMVDQAGQTRSIVEVLQMRPNSIQVTKVCMTKQEN